MHIRNKRPRWMPAEMVAGLEKLPKAVWMDIAYDLAKRHTPNFDTATDEEVLAVILETAEILAFNAKRDAA